MKNNLLIYFLFFFSVTGAFAQTKEKSYPPVVIPSSESRNIHSEYVGADFNISVHFPGNYKTTDNNIPVLFVLDGDNDFGTAIEFLGLLKGECGIKEPLLVAVGYNAMTGSEKNKRMRDYTPSVMKEMPESGGAPKFLSFIEKELIPFVEKNYKTDPNDRSIYGYSLGGLFASYTLLTKPELFKNILIGSPSLWFDNQKIFEYEVEYAKNHKDLPVNVFMEVGQMEGDGMIAPNKKLYKTLLGKNYKSLKIKSIMVDSVGHLTGKPISMFKALEYAYCKPPLKRIEISVKEEILKKYVGEYEINANIKVKITFKDGKLYGESTNNPKPVLLHPETETDFFITEDDIQITFVMNAKKEVTHFILHQKGQHMDVKKIK